MRRTKICGQVIIYLSRGLTCLLPGPIYSDATLLRWRDREERLIPTVLAAEALEEPPAMRSYACVILVVSILGRPGIWPLAMATARPSRVRSAMRRRSKSVNAAKT